MPAREPALPAPPRPPKRPTVLTTHGDARVDDWYWLRRREDPEVISHLEVENAYTAALTAPTGALQEKLYDEIRSRIQETDLSVPVRKGPWLYYARTEEGLQYPIHCRRPAGKDGPEQVLLDENAEAGDSGYFALGGLVVSPDHSLLAWSSDLDGSERYKLRVRDLSTGADIGEPVENTYYGLAWASDDDTVFFTRPDASMRPHQLWRHRVRGGAGDEMVFDEADPHFYLGVQRAKDGSFVFLQLESKVTTEVWALRADDPGGTFDVIEPRRQDVEYSVVHHEGRFLILTNDGAEDFRLVEVPDTSPGRAGWRDLVPARDGVRLEAVEEMAAHLVLLERAEASTRLRVLGLEDGTDHLVAKPEEVSTVWLGPNPEFEARTLRFEYTSMVTPRSVFDYDLVSREAVLLKQQPVLGGFDPSRYATERLWAPADDGTQVPISIVYPVGLPRDGTAPCLVYGYGSYEASMDPTFSSIRLSLLDRGFSFAVAHVRGGGELGRHWYTEGKYAAKVNTFSDFIACSRHLVGTGWASPGGLVARGGSAGGLLMGAVANIAPGLYRAIVAEVPFVDCLTTILDDTLPLTVMEWEEWGNPVSDAAVYAYMKAYSPYDNVTAHHYPDILATAGLNDPRVSYWEPAKWVARLREADPTARILLKCEMGAGHRGPSGRYDAWRDEAFVMAFVLDEVGITS